MLPPMQTMSRHSPLAVIFGVLIQRGNIRDLDVDPSPRWHLSGNRDTTHDPILKLHVRELK